MLAGETENPSFLALHPSGRFLYAVGEIESFGGRTTGAVSAFAIDAKTGDLTLLNQQPSEGTGPCHLVVDAGGKNVLVANYGGGTVAVLPIGADGRLAAGHLGPGAPGQRARTGTARRSPHAHGIYLDASGRLALAADLGADRIFVYRFDAAKGRLEPHGAAPLAPGSGPRHLAFDATGRRLYAINELASTITLFAYDGEKGTLQAAADRADAAGRLRPGRTRPPRSPSRPTAASSTARTAATTSLAVFRSTGDGRLTVEGHVDVGGSHAAPLRDRSLRPLLLVAHQDSDSIAVFRVDPASGLPAPTGTKLAVAKPVCVLPVRPRGRPMPLSLDRDARGRNLTAALIVGALVGTERERSKALSGNVGIGGVRTFILFALAGAVGSWLSQVLGSPWLFVATVVAVAALTLAGYVVQARVKPNAIGLTTEAAAIGVCLLGGACTAGHAAGGARARDRGLGRARLQGADARAGGEARARRHLGRRQAARGDLHRAAAAAERADRSLGCDPAAVALAARGADRRALARRLRRDARARHRSAARRSPGSTGGLVSSTAVTLAFARRSREENGEHGRRARRRALLIAWTVMGARVVFLTGFIHAPLVVAAAAAPRRDDAVTLGAVALLLRRSRATCSPRRPGRSRSRTPSACTSAVKFGLLFAVVLLVVGRRARRYFPGQGYYVVAALAGLTDVDAITLSMAALARDGGTDVGDRGRLDGGRGARQHARQVRDHRGAGERRAAPARGDRDRARRRAGILPLLLR